MRLAALCGQAALLAMLAPPATAHDGHRQGPPLPVARPAPAVTGPESPIATLPFAARIGGEFELLDQDGRTQRLSSFAGRYPLIFFGYANCDGICSVALPRMAEALELLGDAGAAVQPVLITVDPDRDSPAAMRAALPRIHPRFIGLTGSAAALAAARRAFQVDSVLAYTDPDRGPVYAHGGFIYLMGPDGRFLTLMPPVLAPERIAEILRGYLNL